MRRMMMMRRRRILCMRCEVTDFPITSNLIGILPACEDKNARMVVA